MTTAPGLLAIDQGTTSSRAIVFDRMGGVVSLAQEEFAQIYPANGWVEHDPQAIWSTTLSTCRAALAGAQNSGVAVAAAGITNQRETTLIWDKETGKPLHHAIVWQDRRTGDVCARLRDEGCEGDVRAKTGLLLDPYFSATKAAWILDHVDGARARAHAGKLAFGTVDTYLLWHLTGGRVHATDVTNASRTSLFNIHTLDWDEDLLELFTIPRSILPEVRECADDFGVTDAGVLGVALPITGIAGDQQAAAIGQTCFAKGDIKSTYGTGCFVILNTGQEVATSENRLLSTIAYRVNGETTYALEGSIFVAGAGVQWLRDGIGVIESAAQTEGHARGLSSNTGVYIVPAFTGLGAPHWDADIRGAIFGLTRDSDAAVLSRAMVESVVYQTHDLFVAMAQDGVRPTGLKVDGGMVANAWMCGFLADILDMPVDRPVVKETTALGAAFLAGLGAGVYTSLDEIKDSWRREDRFTPSMAASERQQLVERWSKAVQAATLFSG